MAYIPTLKTKYKEEIVASLMKEYNYKTVMQCPRLLKITLNQGLGKAAIADKKVIDKGIEEMTAITGQKAVATKSRKDISNFKLRRGMPIGVRVTLRGERMYEFLERLVTASIPRIRDFRGINDKGKVAKVLKVMPEKNRAIVEGVNVNKKHTKPNAKNTQGGIVEQEAPIHISNLMVVVGKTPTKIGRRVDEKTGKIVRYSKKTGEEIK